MTDNKKNGFERPEWGEILRVQNNNKSQQDKKIKFDTKIKRGRKMVKWNKGMEEQNIRFETY